VRFVFSVDVARVMWICRSGQVLPIFISVCGPSLRSAHALFYLIRAPGLGSLVCSFSCSIFLSRLLRFFAVRCFPLRARVARSPIPVFLQLSGVCRLGSVLSLVSRAAVLSTRARCFGARTAAAVRDKSRAARSSVLPVSCC
jgi:hypothetical protein